MCIRDRLEIVTVEDGPASTARGGHATAAASSRRTGTHPLQSPTAAAAKIDANQQRHQSRWLEDSDEGLRYRLKHGLLGKTFWCTNERSCFAWRPVRPTDLQPPVFIQVRFNRIKALVDRWLSYQHHLGEDPRGKWTEPAGDAARREH